MADEGIPTINLANLAAHFSDEGKAYELLERVRWRNGPVCPHCGTVDEATYLEPKGEGRKTRQGKVSHRRVWKCRACRKQFSVTVGTIFERSHIPLPKWLLAIHMLCSAKNGMSAHELHRTLGVSYKTAWFMAHRIRFAMTRSPLAEKLVGIVEADETYVGGRRRHGQGRKEKTPVLTLINRETGEARSQVVAEVTAKTLRSALIEEIDRERTHLMTDSLPAYKKIGPTFQRHSTVDHWKKEYARGTVTTNTVEGFFGQLKRSINGTYHKVSREHLHRYLAEFDLRYTTRTTTDSQRTVMVLEKTAGKRLMYREPVGQ